MTDRQKNEIPSQNSMEISMAPTPTNTPKKVTKKSPNIVQESVIIEETNSFEEISEGEPESPIISHKKKIIVKKTTKRRSLTTQSVPKQMVTEKPLEITIKLDRRFRSSIYKPNYFIHEKIPYAIVHNFLNTQSFPNIPQEKLENMRLRAEAFRDKIRQNSNFKNKHRLSDHKWGRLIPDAGLSLSVINRPLRHTLAKGLYRDIDMQCCAPNVYLEMCKRNKLPCNAIRDYIENIVSRRNELMTTYNIDRHQAKEIVIALMYGSSLLKKRKELNIDPSIKSPQWLLHFRDQIKALMTLVWTHNKHIIEDVEAEEPNRYATEYDRMTSCFALYYQTIERILQETAISYLIKEKRIRQNVIIPCQDGFLIPSQFWYADILSDCTKAIKKKHNFSIPFVEKVFDEVLTLENTYKTYEDEKIEFEKTKCKIVKQSIFIDKDPLTGEHTFMSKTNLMTAYQHMTLPNGKSFIQQWLQDPNMRRYDDMDVYPPPKISPPNIYNLWELFAMQRYDTPYDPDNEALQVILDHIKLLCNHEEPVFEYIKSFIAHMFQFPGIKMGVMPIFVDERQGGGKSWLMEAIGTMVGGIRYFTSAEPEEHVWGKFNDKMSDAFFVNLDELEKNSSKGAISKIKKLITDPRITIHPKGEKAYTCYSYHRFMGSGNPKNGEPMVGMNSNDRRFLLIKSSDEKIGDSQYFSMIYKYLDNTQVMRTLFDFFYNYKGSPEYPVNKLHEIKKPMTVHQQTIIDCNRPIIDRFFEDLTRSHIGQTKSFSSQELFQIWLDWLESNGLEKKGETSMNFSKTITMCKLPGIHDPKNIWDKKKKTNFRHREIEFEKLEKHFKIGCQLSEE